MKLLVETLSNAEAISLSIHGWRQVNARGSTYIYSYDITEKGWPKDPRHGTDTDNARRR